MWEWLLTSIDPNRLHHISDYLSWHGRLMVVAWGFLSPIAILIARFAKIAPWQKWPQNLDSHFWWNSHWITHSFVIILTCFGLYLVLADNRTEGIYWQHTIVGYSVICGSVFQALSGFFRGSKGGPTAPAKDGSWRGDHYDMTRWRIMFEFVHKLIGYSTLCLAFFATMTGLWAANAPRWMFLALISWWVLFILCFMMLQKRGYAIDTYQAIWGPDPKHPGNQKTSAGWAVRRPSDDL